MLIDFDFFLYFGIKMDLIGVSVVKVYCVKIKKVSLKMNLGKPIITTPEDKSVYVGEELIESVIKYVYLGRLIKTAISRTATERLVSIFRNKQIPINFKIKIFNSCILPLMTYGMETMSLIVRSANKAPNDPESN